MLPLNKLAIVKVMMMGSLCCCIVVLRILREWHHLRTAAMATPVHLTSGLARCEAALHGYGKSFDCLFYAKTMVFQLYHGGDMMYEMRSRKLVPTLVPIQGISHTI